MSKKSRKEEFEFSSFAEPSIIAEYLESLARAIKEGSVRLSSGQDEICLMPEDAIELDIEAKKKEGKSKLTLKFAWETKVAIKGGPLLISVDEEPKIEPEEKDSSLNIT